jgi:hypothetical protein
MAREVFEPEHHGEPVERVEAEQLLPAFNLREVTGVDTGTRGRFPEGQPLSLSHSTQWVLRWR